MAILSHDKMRELLAGDSGKAFMKRMTEYLYRWVQDIPVDALNYRIFRELTIRYYNGDKNKWGDDKADNYRFDAVMLVEPGYRALARHYTYSVGLELKGDAEDLKRDEKISKYIGWTDFFFIGVPDELAEDAKNKVSEIINQDAALDGKIGVMGVETGTIYQYPSKIDVPTGHRLQVYEQIIFNYYMKDDNTVSFDLRKLELQELPDFIIPNDCNNQLNTEENITATINTEETDNSKASHKRLTQAEKAERTESREKSKARIAEQKKELERRNATLMPETREALASLTDRDSVVFWTIRDAGEDGIDSKNIPQMTGQNQRAITRSIASLKEAGLIELEGSKKTGKFKVIGEAAHDSRCMTCQLRDECQGNSLKCGSYEPIQQF